ncbi:flavin reductase domain-containing FMN-binding protein [Ectopseudomonas oleovorans]|uniref:Flavin reductase domain-containing FMN-binding protein n=1 Tax=Ectopseudomonas oleovorans TaxID=301 RepID=A0A379PNX9_ECTOL|nr:flavin reductase domain-containing FMN-binding protein [Pseudomonas oleovorans]
MLVNVNTRDDGSLKDSLRNAQSSGELAIQLVSFAQAEAMNDSAAILPHEVSEFAHCDIASQPCERIDVQRVVGAAVTFECRVAQIQPYPPQQPNCHLIFAEVLLAHIDDAVLNEQGVSTRSSSIWSVAWGAAPTAAHVTFSRCSGPEPVLKTTSS